VHFEKALELDPGEPSARAGLIAIFAGETLDQNSLSDAETVLQQVNVLRQANDWVGIREIDAALAKFHPGSLLFASANRARVQWRILLGDAADGLRAIAIIDELLSRQRTPAHFLLRASAGILAKDEKLAWAALAEVARWNRVSERIRAQALALARSLGDPPEGSTTIQRLSRIARARR
jgi:hypothetical protein